MIKRILATVIILFLSFILAKLVNHNFIEKIIIDEKCEYDIENIKTGKLFDLFYTISSNTGYHPEPSLFNLLFTVFISLLIGIFISYRFIWKTQDGSDIP